MKTTRTTLTYLAILALYLTATLIAWSIAFDAGMAVSIFGLIAAALTTGAIWND